MAGLLAGYSNTVMQKIVFSNKSRIISVFLRKSAWEYFCIGRITILLKSRCSPAEHNFLPRPVQIFVNHRSFCYEGTKPLEGGASALVRKTRARIGIRSPRLCLDLRCIRWASGFEGRPQAQAPQKLIRRVRGNQQSRNEYWFESLENGPPIFILRCARTGHGGVTRLDEQGMQSRWAWWI